MKFVGEIEAAMAQAHRVPAVDGYALAATVTQPEHGARDWVIVTGTVLAIRTFADAAGLRRYSTHCSSTRQPLTIGCPIHRGRP